jgi:putative sigma-54 modulation protein
LIFKISGKHIEITDAIKTYAEEKTSKLPKYYSSINQIEVIINGNKSNKISVEMIARAEHNHVFVVTETSDDAYKSIDFAAHRLEERLRRRKAKERDDKHASEAGKE